MAAGAVEAGDEGGCPLPPVSFETESLGRKVEPSVKQDEGKVWPPFGHSGLEKF
jgi:hypothetical protein